MMTPKTENLTAHIGERIRQLRTAKHFSQGDIENKTGMLRCYISRVENGHTTPSLETLERFAAAFGTPLYKLFADGSEVPSPTNMPPAMAPKSEPSSPPDDPFFLRLKEILETLSDGDRHALITLAEKLARRHSDK